MEFGRTFESGLREWLNVHSLGRKPRSQEFNGEIVGIIRRRWPDTRQLCEKITSAEVLSFAERVAHYCPSRWNAIVSALRFALPGQSHLLKRRPVRAKERPILSQLEFARLLAELDRLPQSRAGLVIRFLAHTGLRINEARKLRWSDVHPDGILVPASITKNGRPRQIPLVNGITETLERLKTLQDGLDHVIPQAECKRALLTACARAGLPRLSHHDFRHLFATRCVQSGVDLPTVARWLGHSDGGALLGKTYYHLADEHSRAMAMRVAI